MVERYARVPFRLHSELKRQEPTVTDKGILVMDIDALRMASLHALAVDVKTGHEALGNILIRKGGLNYDPEHGPVLSYYFGEYTPDKRAHGRSAIVHPEDLIVPDGYTLCRVHSHLGYGARPASAADIQAGANMQKSFPDAVHLILNIPREPQAGHIEFMVWRVKDPYGSASLDNHEVLTKGRIPVEELDAFRQLKGIDLKQFFG